MKHLHMNFTTEVLELDLLIDVFMYVIFSMIVPIFQLYSL